MRIAVSYINGMIFPHFGHSEQFKVYDVEDGKIVKESIISTDGQGHSALAGVLHDIKADTLVCGGIGGCAIEALDQMGIELYAGVYVFRIRLLPYKWGVINIRQKVLLKGGICCGI